MTEFPDLSDFSDVSEDPGAPGASRPSRPSEPPQAQPARLGDRLCQRVGCGRAAEATLTADYGDRMMAVGPLSPERTPPALDLCAAHRDALSPPEGWAILEHDPSREPS